MHIVLTIILEYIEISQLDHSPKILTWKIRKNNQEFRDDVRIIGACSNISAAREQHRVLHWKPHRLLKIIAIRLLELYSLQRRISLVLDSRTREAELMRIGNTHNTRVLQVACANPAGHTFHTGTLKNYLPNANIYHQPNPSNHPSPALLWLSLRCREWVSVEGQANRSDDRKDLQRIKFTFYSQSKQNSES